MSLIVVKCALCDGTSTNPGEVSVDINFNKTDFCDSCNHSKTKSRIVHFCSVHCFLKYIKTFDNNLLKASEDLKNNVNRFSTEYTDPIVISTK